jgi:HSP20 family protein
MTRTLGPLLEVARIQSEINRLFDNLLDLGSAGRPAAGWLPNVDVLETADSLLITAELPGVSPSELTVTSNGGDLCIRGEKRRGPVPEEARFHVAERPFGPFRRVIQLSAPVNTRAAEATFENGLLRLRFPKVPNRRGEEVLIPVRTP